MGSSVAVSTSNVMRRKNVQKLYTTANATSAVHIKYLWRLGSTIGTCRPRSHAQPCKHQSTFSAPCTVAPVRWCWTVLPVRWLESRQPTPPGSTPPWRRCNDWPSHPHMPSHLITSPTDETTESQRVCWRLRFCPCSELMELIVPVDVTELRRTRPCAADTTLARLCRGRDPDARGSRPVSSAELRCGATSSSIGSAVGSTAGVPSVASAVFSTW